ncbi:hypothetical protein EXIGLDRAFT_456939 [Exidia glandulosa HHB12029]|uniref:Protein kinase domain-containing protein n=1 Tax=Exidia glandulosa HHB12029 TaxID=1314781 RepID=A0A165PN79_EXIGL|nr:hypothetical protein EXIGLDRAFT_456939 [Exidia glandulosa HHB12029]
MLSTGDDISFIAEHVIQSGHKKFSQTAFGRLKSGNNVCPWRLCVKLFDERFFPVPTLEEFDGEEDEDFEKLRGLHFADQMLRREEAAYDRLAKFQGTAIPHAYGFHEFDIVENGSSRHVLGFLMEVIEGRRLGDMVDELNDEWSVNDKRALIKRMRHLVRLLNALSISQRDWNLNQVICVPRSKVTVGNRVDNMDLVLIDFAFATQPSGQRLLREEVNDVGDLFMVLEGLGGPELFLELGWFDRETYEQ